MIAGPLLREATDTYGRITGVAVDTFDRGLLSKVKIAFESGALMVESVAEDDSLQVTRAGGAAEPLLDVSGLEPWHQLVGSQVLWIWRLVNQRGYEDGLQISVRTAAGDFTLQLVTVASSLKPAVVKGV